MRFATRKTWNYLRVRGEYRSLAANICLCMELPPRARRILIQAIEQPFDCGTTSACAENTRKALVKSVCVWNYLRVRGEYMRSPQRGSQPSELPPRARRIHRHHPHSIRNHGTTSACAENTFTYIDDGIKPRNYLRVRGEYDRLHPSPVPTAELPPRARRIHLHVT